VTWTGMFLFGRATWLVHGEVFRLVFGIFARFAPVNATGETLALRPPAVGLAPDAPLAPSMAALVVALLATVTFDGLLETPLWAQVDAWVLNAPPASVLWTTLDLREDQALRLARSIALPLVVLLFIAAYLLVCRAMAALTGGAGGDAFVLARWLVPSLVPISIAYHVAHYFAYLIIGSQYVIPI